MMRRHDIDWIRTIVLFLLIIYHAFASFMPFAPDIRFPINDGFLVDYWFLMELINIWRIPILFVISGMGVYFAIQNRSLLKIIKDRLQRILVPYFFGCIVLCPLAFLLVVEFYDNYINGIFHPFYYYIGASIHLWFLLNIYFYFQILVFLFFYFKNNPDNFFFKFLRKILSFRFGIYIFMIPIVLEAFLINPEWYSMYAKTLHGWVLGFICFFTGFILVALKQHFWESIQKIRIFALIIAVVLYLNRISQVEFEYKNVLIAVESFNWMLVVFAFSARYLNKASKRLSYLSAAVYPVYILHMPLQFAFSFLIFPLEIPPFLKLLLMVVLILFSSLFLYEFLIKRIFFLRPLFGLKFKK